MKECNKTLWKIFHYIWSYRKCKNSKKKIGLRRVLLSISDIKSENLDVCIQKCVRKREKFLIYKEFLIIYVQITQLHSIYIHAIHKINSPK